MEARRLDQVAVMGVRGVAGDPWRRLDHGVRGAGARPGCPHARDRRDGPYGQDRTTVVSTSSVWTDGTPGTAVHGPVGSVRRVPRNAIRGAAAGGRASGGRAVPGPGHPARRPVSGVAL